MLRDFSNMFLLLALLFFFPFHCAFGLNPSQQKIRTVYSSLDPNSIAEHLAFYYLYKDHPEGQKALQGAWMLLTGKQALSQQEMQQIPDLPISIQGIVDLIATQPGGELVSLTQEQLGLLEKLGSRLPNRKLKGYYVTQESGILSLPPEEIDLARGLLLSQYDLAPDALYKTRCYEAMIDLMSLQILAKLSPDASPKEKIRAINRFIFGDMGFRFPPHSLYAKDIDLYTFLPSVIDSRKGVCLGVSILYIAISQRLSLSLEMITPPGHIFVRYRDGDEIINIETTAGGVNLNSEIYLSVDTRSLQQRNIKEVIGLAHYNQASVYWKQNDYQKALISYEKAKAYLPDDKLLTELMGYNYLFAGNEEKGKENLQSVKDFLPDHAVTKEKMAEDFLNGKVDIEGLKTFFLPVDEKRESILEKKKSLETVVNQFPNFRAGIFALASVWLQLNREGEALSILERYHQLEPNDPTAEYYLSVLFLERQNFVNAWRHLKNAEQLTQARDHYPKVLKTLRKELTLHCPE